MTGFVLPLALLPRPLVKGSGLFAGALSDLADNGSAADAELMVQQIQNEIDLRTAQLRVVNDRIEEIARQTEREAEAAAQAARDAVMGELLMRQESSLGEGNDLIAEIDALMTARDEWHAAVIERRLAEQTH